MSLDTLRAFLLWSGAINYGMLLIWVAVALLGRDFCHRIARLFRVAPDRIDAIQYAGILFYKVGIWIFFLIPYIALRIVA